MVKTGPICSEHRLIIELGLLKNSSKWPMIGKEEGLPPKSVTRGGACLLPRRGRSNANHTRNATKAATAAHMVDRMKEAVCGFMEVGS